MALTVVTIAMSALSAHAQTLDPTDRQTVMSSVSSTSTTTVIGGVIITVTVTSSTASLQRYLEQNAVAFRQDITRGAGSTIEDLATVFAVADTRRFGTSLRRHRKTLLQWADPRTMDADSVALFVARLRVLAAGV